MHVLYFHQHFSTPEGSTGTRSYEMSKALIDKDCKVTIVCGAFDRGVTGLTNQFHFGVRRGTVDGIEVIELSIPYGNKVSFGNRIILFLKYALWSCWFALTERYDVVVATSTPLTVAIPGIIAKLFRRKKFIFEVRDLWPELPRAMGIIRNRQLLYLLKAFERTAYFFADRIIALSPGMVDGILKEGVNQNKITQVPNGSDVALFSKKSKFWRPENVSEEDLLLIFSGTHGAANGLNSVIEVAKILVDKDVQSIKFVLVGDGSEKRTLQKKTLESKLDNIIFLPPLPKNQLVTLLRSADLGMQILSNIPEFYYGTSPNKFFDYLAAGLPVLVNHPGWVADIITEHKCGICVSPDDYCSFAANLIEIHDKRKKLVSMSKNSFTLANSKFNRKYLAELWINCVLG